MNKYRVTIQAAVQITKEAEDSGTAEDAAWDEFERINELNDAFDHRILDVEQITHPTTSPCAKITALSTI